MILTSKKKDKIEKIILYTNKVKLLKISEQGQTKISNNSHPTYNKCLDVAACHYKDIMQLFRDFVLLDLYSTCDQLVFSSFLSFIRLLTALINISIEIIRFDSELLESLNFESSKI